MPAMLQQRAHVGAVRQPRVETRGPARVPCTADVRKPCILRAFHKRDSQSSHGWLQRHTARAAQSVPRLAAAEEDSLAPVDLDLPSTAKEAIDYGLQFCAAGRWRDALSVFERALSLPGTGIKRFRDKPAEPSDGEKMAALYNIACCHSQLGDERSGLLALTGCLELGYGDFDQIRGDPDLALLRADSRFEVLLARFEKKGGSLFDFFGGFFGGQK